MRFWLYKWIIFLLGAVLLMSGCGKPQPKPQPSWVLNPPKSDNKTLYGAAVGDTAAAAKNSALGMIAADLFITVQSDMKLTSHSLMKNNSEQTLEEFLSNTRAKTKALNFSNVTVEKQVEFDENKIGVLVSVDRKTLFRDQKAQLDREITAMNSLLDSAKATSKFVRLGLLKNASKKAANILSNSTILGVINPKADTSSYSRFVKDVNKQYNDLKYATKIRIVSDARALYFVQPLDSALSAEGISVVSSGRRTISVQLTGTSQQDKLYGFFIEKLHLNIVTKDKGKIIASSKRVFSGKSRYDFEQARRQAADNFSKALRKEGVFTVMGVI